MRLKKILPVTLRAFFGTCHTAHYLEEQNYSAAETWRFSAASKWKESWEETPHSQWIIVQAQRWTANGRRCHPAFWQPMGSRCGSVVANHCLRHLNIKNKQRKNNHLFEVQRFLESFKFKLENFWGILLLIGTSRWNEVNCLPLVKNVPSWFEVFYFSLFIDSMKKKINEPLQFNCTQLNFCFSCVVMTPLRNISLLFERGAVIRPPLGN